MKGSKCLLNNKIKTTEAPSPEEEAAREELWPRVKKQGKRARGPLSAVLLWKTEKKKIDNSEATETLRSF